MKKLLVLILCVVMLIGVVGCSSEDKYTVDEVVTQVPDKKVEVEETPTEVVLPEYEGEYYKVRFVVKDTFGNVLDRNCYVLPDRLKYEIPSDGYQYDLTKPMNLYLKDSQKDLSVQAIYGFPKGTTYKFDPTNEDGTLRPAPSIVDCSRLSDIYKEYKNKNIITWSYVDVPVSGTIDGDCEIVITVKPELEDKPVKEEEDIEDISGESTEEVTGEEVDEEVTETATEEVVESNSGEVTE